MEKSYEVLGMTCVMCKANVEKAIIELNGVESAKVNLLENEVHVVFDENVVNENDFYKAVKDAGYELLINKQKNLNIYKLKLIISIVLVIILMIISMAFMHNSNKTIFIQFLLSLIIILLNINYYKSGFKALFILNPNMDSLVSLSSFVSFIYSIYSSYKILNGFDGYHLFFETSAMVLVIVSIGKFIENNTKKKASKVIRGLATLIPMQANLKVNDEIIEIPTEKLKKNDLILIRPGESIPIDGIIIKGYSSIDESNITGESNPVNKTIDNEVIGGTVNISGTIEVKVTKNNNMTVLSNIINLTKKAANEKIPIERFADIVSKYFVFSVIGISIITLIVWLIISKDIELALNFSLSVLVISCPCALGLATPAAIGVAINNCAKNGILIKKPEILEKMPFIKNIIFDKTGTLTNNKLKIVDIKEEDPSFLDILSSIEKGSLHPIAKTILSKYDKGKINFDSIEFIPSKGLKAIKDNDIYLAGNEKLLNNLIPNQYLQECIEYNYSYIALAKNDKFLGIIYLTDTLRPTSVVAIDNLKTRNINPIMCTGDNLIATKRIANILKINEYKAEVKPEDKHSLVIEKKKEGIVGMVGDGVNDAIALSSADISISIKNATDIANTSSDIILLNNDLNDISFIYDVSKKTLKIIKQNFIWALVYNAIFIPLAAGLFYYPLSIKLSPMIGAFTMWFSSLFVILNALRIYSVSKGD